MPCCVVLCCNFLLFCFVLILLFDLFCFVLFVCVCLIVVVVVFYFNITITSRIDTKLSNDLVNRSQNLTRPYTIGLNNDLIKMR